MYLRSGTMFSIDCFLKFSILLYCLFVVLFFELPANAAMNPSFELDAQALGVSTASKQKTTTVKVSTQVSHSRKNKVNNSGSAKGTTHVVKSGDNLFKILMRDYALSNDEAELFIEEIRRVNNIYDIRRLKIGQKISIPAVCRRSDGSLQGIQLIPSSVTSAGGVGQFFGLESPISPLSEKEANYKFRQMWDRLVPPLSGDLKPIKLDSANFSLTLDPQRYPIYSSMDNSRILVDQNDSIPPLVKAIVMEKDPSVRIVSESPVNGKHFLTAMLASAGFYSVEKDFSIEFGNDPKLIVRSDFKIEKTADSLLKQDVVLLNSGRVPLPSAIGGFLKKEGFSVYEPFASLQPVVPVAPRPLYQITSKKQSDIIDALLSTVSIVPDKNRNLDVFATDNNGVSLSVKAERYFECGGQRHVLTHFDGDPVTYTLFRILEAKGYQITILEGQDDFRKITDKLLSRMRIQGVYAKHTLGYESDPNYSIQMSGYKLEGAGFPADGMFLTDLELDRVFHDLLTGNGYSITSK